MNIEIYQHIEVFACIYRAGNIALVKVIKVSIFSLEAKCQQHRVARTRCDDIISAVAVFAAERYRYFLAAFIGKGNCAISQFLFYSCHHAVTVEGV